jgi:hypothetical protein
LSGALGLPGLSHESMRADVQLTYTDPEALGLFRVCRAW